jgi:uncharacterized membrane protein
MEARTMADEPPTPETLVAVTFAEHDNAVHALARLRELESAGEVGIEGLALVTRNHDGQLVANHLTDDARTGRAGGGLIGLLVGILGGPVGILLGGSAGVLAGALVDGRDADEADSVMSDLSKSIQVGETAVVAEFVEDRPESIEAAMTSLGGNVLRRPVDEVKAEVAVADKAQRAAEKEAAAGGIMRSSTARPLRAPCSGRAEDAGSRQAGSAASGSRGSAPSS